MGRHVCSDNCELHKVCVGDGCGCRRQDRRPTACYACRLAKTACRPAVGGGGMCKRCLKKGSLHHCNRRGGEGNQGEGAPAGRRGSQYPVDFGPDAGEALLAGGMAAPSPIIFQQPTPPESVRSGSSDPAPVLFPGRVPPHFPSVPVAPAPVPFTPAFAPFAPAPIPVTPAPTPVVPVFAPFPPVPAPIIPAPASVIPAPTPITPAFATFAPVPAPNCNCLLRLARAKEAISQQLPENNPIPLVPDILHANYEVVNSLAQFVSCDDCYGRYRGSSPYIIEIYSVITIGVKALEEGVLLVASLLALGEKHNTLRVLTFLGAFTRRCGGFGPWVEDLKAKITELSGAIEQAPQLALPDVLEFQH
ncbi:hypothetical protein B0H65DRAFT_567598 [Neurospora tetraspora]|uniref:Zn(2)-C6 fungal-type domain-containing protein n=1 Tax=Neurospora tetraspora TaxID=94610 RepID=A0AAE0JKS1_9PEZI|nr:hypothetical protein B0H65DRAFT_567598 [Neurospora tetraspora]